MVAFAMEFTGVVRLDQLMQAYGAEWLVLDFNHLFISTSLREEVWLLRHRDDRAITEQVIAEAADFGIEGINADREFHTYSGGEQAILACLLIMAVIKANDAHDVRILLYNVLESLSADNRARLVGRFADLQRTHGARAFMHDGKQLREVTLGC